MNSCNGISPLGFSLLVEPDEVKEEITESGIVLPSETVEEQQHAQVTGVIRAAGRAAWDQFDHPWAHIGDRILYDRYTGMSITGEDGTEYRLINDTQAKAVISDQIKCGELERRVRYER